MFAQGNFDFHSRRRVFAQNLDDAANGLRVFTGLLDNVAPSLPGPPWHSWILPGVSEYPG